ncbi:hypothetical protein GCM10010399_09070 [Dactylosporangium fulvum]|uniref:Zinc-binding dehydrogenase n=1 Tax=Dactylosporangium fulvum TaxID=53359 RepID=A0ABY5W9I3_9ACTN|nr:zinc-binding dehydrogenase [Dactylosporangium fulvum]UWP86737.1 zinc-binding dehydrogenase [Dactylosporangium fulvum]
MSCEENGPAGLLERASAAEEAGFEGLWISDLLGVRAGETVLIHGASGSVGTIAVQLAVARGATVIGTASEDNQDYVRSLGAIPMLYGEGLVDRIRASSRHVDAVFDVAGKGALPDSIVLRGGTDRIVTIADPAAGCPAHLHRPSRPARTAASWTPRGCGPAPRWTGGRTPPPACPDVRR